MDNDDWRRGKPTLHKVYNEGHAVLVGDFLLTYAFEILAIAPYLSEKQKLKLIQVLSKRSGGHGMVGGQSIDLMAEGKEIDPSLLLFMHQKKTADLFIACFEFGGVLCKVDEEEMDTLKTLGFHLGMVFQLVDDLLEVKSNTLHLGKSASSDKQNQKSTILSLYSVQEAENIIAHHQLHIKEALKTLKRPGTDLKDLIDTCINRTK